MDVITYPYWNLHQYMLLKKKDHAARAISGCIANGDQGWYIPYRRGIGLQRFFEFLHNCFKWNVKLELRCLSKVKWIAAPE